MRRGIVRRVAELALQIEPDRERVLQWIVYTRLPLRGRQTTFELACNGQGERVLMLLHGLLAQPDLHRPAQLPAAH